MGKKRRKKGREEKRSEWILITDISELQIHP
jgi:hypothetical protein